MQMAWHNNIIRRIEEKKPRAHTTWRIKSVHHVLENIVWRWRKSIDICLQCDEEWDPTSQHWMHQEDNNCTYKSFDRGETLNHGCPLLWTYNAHSTTRRCSIVSQWSPWGERSKVALKWSRNDNIECQRTKTIENLKSQRGMPST